MIKEKHTRFIIPLSHMGLKKANFEAWGWRLAVFMQLPPFEARERVEM